MQEQNKKYSEFRKYSYIQVSNIDNSLSKKVSYFFKLNNNWRFKNAYYADSKSIINDNTVSIDDRLRIKRNVSLYNILDYFIIGTLGVSIYNHYKKGYLSTSSKLIDIYLIVKFTFYLYSLFSIKFLIFKTQNDPILYKYYSEREYNNVIHSSKIRQSSEYIHQMHENRSLIANK